MRVLEVLAGLAPPRRQWRWVACVLLLLAVVIFTAERKVPYQKLKLPKLMLQELVDGSSIPWRTGADHGGWEDHSITIPSVHHDIDEQYGGEVLPVTAMAKGRVLVTGGGGMIGRQSHSFSLTTGKQVITRLLSGANPMPITVLDKIFYDDEVEAIRKAFPKADLRVVIGDIRDTTKLREAMTSDVVGVINFAAVSRVLWCLENEKDCEAVNVGGVGKILEEFKGHWFIQASSREVRNFLCTRI